MFKNKIFLDRNYTEKTIDKKIQLQVMLFVLQEYFFLSVFLPKEHDF